ncbi:hypothetical protein CAPTEDRAFT_192901 [Capitella teleta]|uniref:LRRCT domain-containing protein n=1 Tax=Capitella teleta TaxID=283909 RepID=R7U3R9_CAPTE|nr:hypothetical protein CAPTEDRAFT_192901 [Capitella teleta]|eukprot:ELT98301.1 hypothetical protein CAPTEDRAFT_192901 [Capitella teleta]
MLYAVLMCLLFEISLSRGVTTDLSTRGLTEIPTNIQVTTQVIRLADNNFTSIPDFAFEALSDLLFIEIYNCRITNVGNFAFSGTKLSSLYIGNNFLTSLPNLTAVASTANGLYMRDNLVARISQRDLFGIRMISELDLAANPLLALPDFLAGLPLLTTLTLEDVSFDCCWKAASLQTSSLVLQVDDEPCKDPEEFRLVPWTVLMPNELEETTCSGFSQTMNKITK